MGDQQKRIHPIQDVEAAAPQAQTLPLMPRGTSKSDAAEPPPLQRAIPVIHSKPPKRRRSCCRRCLRWTVSLLLLLILLIAITLGILYFVFQPKIPNYSVDRLQVTQFNLTADSILQVTFSATITATNPNEKIGIYYQGGGSHLSVWYIDTKLCEGSIPKFYQGHQNTTQLSVPLNGQTENAAALTTTLQQQQQQTGNIPLNLRVDQPVRIKLGKLKLMEVKFLVRCRLLVDSLNPNDPLRIQNSSCSFRLRL